MGMLNIDGVQTELTRRVEEADFGYSYPLGLKFHPSSELHKYVVEQINDRVIQAQPLLDGTKDDWEKLDWSTTCYIPLNEEEAKDKDGDFRKPVSVIVPATLAALETLTTYAANTFLQDPIHRYRGRGGKEALIEAALRERVVAAQNSWFKEGLHLISQWRQAYLYGLGIVSPCWTKHIARRPADVTIPDAMTAMLLQMDLPGVKIGDIVRLLEQDVPIFEGNQLECWDTPRCLLDPHTPLNRIQEAEFIGHQVRTNVMHLLGREADPEEHMFNVKAARLLAAQGDGKSIYYRDDSPRKDKYDIAEFESDTTISNVVDVTRMFVNLIPHEWGLGDKKTPEKWMFAVAGDAVVIQAQPLPFNHGMFPVGVAAPSTSGHDVVPVSTLAATMGLQQTIDFFVTSQVKNVKAALNMMLLVDPTGVFMEDVLAPTPGKIIRTKQSVFGGGSLDQWVKQLNVQDVTSQHIDKANAIMGMFKEAVGATDMTQGIMGGLPDRPTEVGINAALIGANSRMALQARMMAMQSMQDLALMESENTTQYMADRVAVSLTGRYERQLREQLGVAEGETEVMVGPDQIGIDAQVEVRTGGMPGGESVQAYTTIIQALLGVEGVGAQLASGLNIPGVFQHWAKLQGAESIAEFLAGGGDVLPQVMPDADLEELARKGDVAPAGVFG